MQKACAYDVRKALIRDLLISIHKTRGFEWQTAHTKGCLEDRCASVSVRIEKRANCAKNNKPKSGGLFLVNARPFPEHSSSIATFSAGGAWLEANRAGEPVSFCGPPECNGGPAEFRRHLKEKIG